MLDNQHGISPSPSVIVLCAPVWCGDGECIARAAPAFGVADKDSVLDEWQNVAESRVLRTFGQFGVFRCRKLALESIKQAIQHKALSVVDRDAGVSLPESRLGEDRG